MSGFDYPWLIAALASRRSHSKLCLEEQNRTYYEGVKLLGCSNFILIMRGVTKDHRYCMWPLGERTCWDKICIYKQSLLYFVNSTKGMGGLRILNDCIYVYKVSWSFIIHSTFLEPHRKSAFQQNTKKVKRKDRKMAPYSFLVVFFSVLKRVPSYFHCLGECCSAV